MDTFKSTYHQRIIKKQCSIQFDYLSPHHQIEKNNDKYTIKNIVMNVKLKTRISKLLSQLSSRRYQKLTPWLLNKIKDNSQFLSSCSKMNEYICEDINQFQSQQTIILPKKTEPIGNNKKNLRIIEEKIKQIIASIPIIDPNSLYKLVWDSLQSIIIVMMITVAPIKLALQDYAFSYYFGSWNILLAVLILLILDIFIRLNTAFFRNGRIEVNRIQIMKNYFGSEGICDSLLIQSLTYELISTQFINEEGLLTQSEKSNWLNITQHILLLILLYYKTTKLHKYLFKIEETFSFKRRTLNILSLVKLLFFIIKVAHAFACIWLYIGRTNYPNSWLTNIHDGWLVEYLKAYYFITVTMTTIGYGDIVPTNTLETVISIFSMIIACGVFGYTINSIGSIFLELKKEGEEKKENLFIINRYMSEKNISRDLQYSIREYLEYYWSQWKDDNMEKEQKILDQLSEEMRMSLLLQANRMILEDCQLLQRNFTQDAIQKSVSIIKEKKLTPNEYLINSTEDISKSGILFFVQRGEIDIYQEFSLDSSSLLSSETFQNQQGSQYLNINQTFVDTIRRSQEGLNQVSQKNTNMNQNIINSNEQQLKDKKKFTKHVYTIKQGDHFGEMSFFTNFPNKFIAKSRNFSKILYIERDKYLHLLRENHFQDDFETFCNIRDNINQNELQCLFKKCQFCNSYDHTPLQCPIVHYQPLHMLLIYKHNFSQDISERKFTLRRKVQIKNCLHYLESTFSEYQRFYEKNEQYIEENYKLVEYSESNFSDDSSQNYCYNSETDTNQQQQLQYNEDDQIHQKPKILNKLLEQNDNESEKQITSSENDLEENHITQSKEQSITTTHDPKKVKWRHSFSLKVKESNNEKIEYPFYKKPQFKIMSSIPKNEQIQQYFLQNESYSSLDGQQQKASLASIEINQTKETIQNINYPNSIILRGRARQESLHKQITSKKKITFLKNSESHSFTKKRTISQKIIEKSQESNLEQQGFHQSPAPRKQKRQKSYVSRNEDKKKSIQKQQQQHQQQSFDSSIKLDESGKVLSQSKIKTRQKVKSILSQNEQHSSYHHHENNQVYPTFQFFTWDVKFDSLFENMKIFKNYYPNYNHDKIIQRIKKKRLQENNILKLTFQNKSNNLKGKSLFQNLKNTVNLLKYKAKLKSSKFGQENNISCNNSPRNQQYSFDQTPKIVGFSNNFSDAVLELSNKKSIQEEQKNESRSISQIAPRSIFIQNAKKELKSQFSPLNSFTSTFQEKARKSLQNDLCFNMDDDFNIDSHKESLTNRIRIHYQSYKKKSNLSKEDNIEENELLSE